MSRITAPVGEVTIPIRRGSRGIARLRAGFKQALRRQFLLELLERELQRAVALRLQRFHQKLVFAARFVNVDAAARQHRHAVLRLELQIAQRGPEAHAAHLRLLVLQREITVAARRHLRARDLARHPDVVELRAQQVANARAEFGHGEGLAGWTPRQRHLPHVLSSVASRVFQ